MLGKFLKNWVGDQEDEKGNSSGRDNFYSAEELLSPFLLVFVLVVVLLVSCLGVVMSAFEYRQLFNQHQELIQQRDELQVEWGQLLLEQSAWAANNRVEQQATSVLGMKVPDVEQIEIVKHER
ncbi:cell division protein FtsL [Neptuniibacter sp. QD72_48]|uniref:cell division protein FtsL n=1 Tax=Neptuniibacter sp. QD72_48 TaxID=3398214 RepID=UPI0039F50FFD